MNEERRGRGRPRASVDIVENPRVESLHRRQMPSEAFIAREEAREQESTRTTDAAGVTTSHNRPGTRVMYKPTETMGWEPRTVSVSALRMLVRQGWLERCPECNSEHIDRSGRPSTDPNLCRARPPVAVRVCPQCGKRIYDNQGLKSQVAEDDDPNVIPDEGAQTTPAQRTRLLLDLHLWARHPREAQMMGRPPLPTALKEIAEGAQSALG